MSADGRVGAALDHCMLMVHDLDAAAADFARLGFRVAGGGRLSGGIENRIIPFGVKGPYLELVALYEHGAESVRDNEEFLAVGEGVIYVGLRVESAARTMARLRELGLPVQGPFPGTVQRDADLQPPPVLWYSVVLEHPGSIRADPLFFTEYDGAGLAISRAHTPEWARRYDEERSLPHPNGASTLSSVWIAVPRIEERAVRHAALGHRRGREFDLPGLEARAVEFHLDSGALWLMESRSAKGPIDQLLRLRGFGLEVPGVSVEVGDLDAALRAMRPEIARSLGVSDLPSGRGLLIPSTLAHGVWIEFFERRS